MSGTNTASTESKPFVISRTFDAPRDAVWKAWTEAERLKQWFGPKGFTMPACTLDLKPGGIFHYCLTTPQGQEIWGKWVFREIAAPERIVVIQSFSDAAGNVTRNPWNAEWPLESLSTTTLDERNGKTTVTVRWAPHNPTEAELKSFDEGHESMKAGWSGTLDRLAAYLAKA